MWTICGTIKAHRKGSKIIYEKPFFDGSLLVFSFPYAWVRCCRAAHPLCIGCCRPSYSILDSLLANGRLALSISLQPKNPPGRAAYLQNSAGSVFIRRYRVILSADTASEVRADAKPKAQIILCVLSSILATQMPHRSRRSGA